MSDLTFLLWTVVIYLSGLNAWPKDVTCLPKVSSSSSDTIICLLDMMNHQIDALHCSLQPPNHSS